MCACVRTFVTCWEALRAVNQTPAVALHFFYFFGRHRFVNLLCGKLDIESLGFTCNWLVLVGRLAWTSAACTYFRVADKFTTAKRKVGTLYQILRDTQLSFAGCCVGLAQVKETPAGERQNSRVAVTPIGLTSMHNWTNPTLTCTSCHFLLRWKVRRSVHVQNKLFPQLGSRNVEFRTYVHNNINLVQLKPTKKYLQRLLVVLAFAKAMSPP